jgi:hypothetical protein
MTNDLFEDYVHDFGLLVRELAVAAKADKELAQGSDRESFATGYLTALYAVITTMMRSAESFHIPVEKLGLAGLDPDRDLV